MLSMSMDLRAAAGSEKDFWIVLVVLHGQAGVGIVAESGVSVLDLSDVGDIARPFGRARDRDGHDETSRQRRTALRRCEN